MAINIDKLPDYPTNDPNVNFNFTDIGQIITSGLKYIIVFAGLGMLLMLIIGGITLMTAAGDPGKTKDGYGKITAGLVGFLIIVVSHFVTQIIEIVLGVKILGL